MQRPKQQALMFLLGAVLVGGVLGFSAERVFGGAPKHPQIGREAMYDDLGLSPQQRDQMDSVLDARQDQIQALLRPIQPQLDSVKANARAQFRRILTADQWAKFQQRVKEDEARRAKADSTRREQARKLKEQKSP